MYDRADDLELAVTTAMGMMARLHHEETGAHIMRTQHYVRALALAIAIRPSFSERLRPARIARISKAAMLHDIGKVGVERSILLKPGSLTAQEFDAIKDHTVFGWETLVETRRQMPVGRDFLQDALDIAYFHHERWDGSGYPEGLAGEEIPLSARLMAVADVYDALVSARPYKTRMAHEDAIQIIVRAKGSHFEPALVDALEDVQKQFVHISSQFTDE